MVWSCLGDDLLHDSVELVGLFRRNGIEYELAELLKVTGRGPHDEFDAVFGERGDVGAAVRRVLASRHEPTSLQTCDDMGQA